MNINEWLEIVGAFITAVTPFVLGIIAIWTKQHKNGGTTHKKVSRTLEEVEKLAQQVKEIIKDKDQPKQKKK